MKRSSGKSFIPVEDNVQTGWEGIEEAVAIADAKSFAGAAALLKVSTSHVSKVIARLEHRLEAQLFNRTTRRVDLTDTGRAFVEQGRRIIQDRDELLLMVNGAAEPQGDLRITCSIALGERFAAAIVRQFSADYPQLRVTLDLTNRLVDIVGEGYDLAIRTGKLVDHRLVGRQIGLRRIETCASPHYLSATGVPRTIADLASHACLVGSNATWHFEERGRAVAFQPEGRWCCNSGTAIVDAALAGMGICQVPLFYVRDHMAAGRLSRVLPDLGPPPEPIWAVYPARRHLRPKVRNLVDVLEARLQGMIDRS
jgi:DNA-binding transcriptional LysR family regulator